MLRYGYTNVKESYDTFEEIPLRNPSYTKDGLDEETKGCFCSFNRIYRLFVSRKLFLKKQS
jgi:hypothetical protein